MPLITQTATFRKKRICCYPQGGINMALVWLGALYAHRRKGRASGLFNFSLSALNTESYVRTDDPSGCRCLLISCTGNSASGCCYSNYPASQGVCSTTRYQAGTGAKSTQTEKNNQQQPLLFSRYCQQPGVSLSKRIPNTHGYSNVSDPNQSKSFTNKMVDE